MLKEKIMKMAEELNDEIIENRRILHKNPEIGFELEKTVRFVEDKLKEYGYEPMRCGKSGVVAIVGKGEKTILLRADMDALPIVEDNDLEFKSTNGYSHACGHDCHTAMLLGAAKILKTFEAELEGKVKLMFQPAEEVLGGAKDMIENGLLENPKVDYAFACHISSGKEESEIGKVLCPSGQISRTGDALRIIIQGKDAHGSRTDLGVDSINVASFIQMALQTIISKEIPSSENSVVLVGKIEGGTTCNSVPGITTMEVSVRTDNKKNRDFIVKRIEEITYNIAKAFRATASIENFYSAPALIADDILTKTLSNSVKKILGEENIVDDYKIEAAGGEDFAYVSEEVPSAFFYLGAGSIKEGYEVPHHSPFTKFDESVFKSGAAMYAFIAMDFLKENK